MASFLDIPAYFFLLFLFHILISLPSTASSIPSGSAKAAIIQQRVPRDRIWANQIRCIGHLPNYLSQGFGPSGTPISWDTPRRLCAKTWYGGQPAANYGGYCAKRTTLHPQLFFESNSAGSFRIFRPPPGPDVPTQADAGDQITLHQMGQTFCQLRCRCLQPDGRTIGPWPAEEIVASEPGTLASYDLNPRREVLPSIVHHARRLPGGVANLPRIYSLVLPEDVDSTTHVTVMGFHPLPVWFRPGCLNLLPLRLPPPFVLADPANGIPGSFATAQELCASVFQGGSDFGNAGFTCIADPANPGRRKLSIIGHLTHPSLSPDHGRGLMAHYWCLSVCKCNLDEPREQIAVSVDGIEYNSGKPMLVRFDGNQVHLSDKDGSDSQGGLQLLEEGESCEEKGKGCVKVADLKLSPKALEEITFKIPELGNGPFAQAGLGFGGMDSSSRGRCGGVCDGPRQCGGDCMCVVDKGLVSQAGRGLGWPGLALCTAITVSSGRGRRVRFAGLGKRDVEDWECPCNRTVVGRECCEWPSGNGPMGNLDWGVGEDV